MNSSNRSGFTLIELLMVILVIAILTVIGITQFVNYGKDSRDAATKSNLQTLRRAISEKNGMMRLRCNVQDSSFPPVANINANNITQGDSPCVGGAAGAGDVPVLSDRLFIAAGIPVNPWSASIHKAATGQAESSKVWDCEDDGGGAHNPTTGLGTGTCDQASGKRCADGTNFTGTKDLASESGWCYDHSTGKIWANSANNDGKNAGTGDEFGY